MAEKRDLNPPCYNSETRYTNRPNFLSPLWIYTDALVALGI